MNYLSAWESGQRKIKEFMKHVHPDFFVNAPEVVRQVNSESVQEVIPSDPAPVASLLLACVVYVVIGMEGGCGHLD